MTALSKAEYLQRYLSSGKEEKEKKAKKKRKNKGESRPTGLRIVEDDAFLSVSAKFKDVDSDEEREDIAIISSISRQIEEKAREAPKFRRSFKPLDETEEDIKPSVEDLKNGNTGREYNGSTRLLDDKKYSDDDARPSTSQVKRRHDSDSDHSPPRRNDSPPQRLRKRHDSDQSPVRRRHDSDQSPVRRRHDSDQSPGRRRHDSDQSPVRRRHSSDSDQSPVRQRRDFPPQRLGHSPKRRRHDSDSDLSPPRANEKRSRSKRSSESSPSSRKRYRSREKHAHSGRSHPAPSKHSRRRSSSSSDQSPPRKHRAYSPPAFKSSDRRRHDSDESSRKGERIKGRERRITSPEKLGKETQRTLDGKVAGLQSAEDLKKESENIRQKETKMFEEMDASVSGRYAETTVREKQVRKRREKPEDKERKEREAKKQAELQEKYNLWNKGVAQTERREKQLEEMARVAAEPLARMADDKEMNRHLKDIIHEEDPMAPILISKKREKAIDRGELIYPTYQGEYPANRFGIRPGYRWDGVDRSNGFEAKLAQAKNRRDAQEKEYYQNLQLYE